MSAVLPESYEEDTLSTMLPGEQAYTLPWGMWVDRRRRCWLHPGYPAHDRREGTALMPVRRLEDGSFEVDLRGLPSRWSPHDAPGYVGEVDAWLTVSNLIT